MALEAFIGEIMMWAGNFAPRGWALCNGQLLSIQQNQALFSLIGTTYGGDGINTFSLPDLQGRVPLHWGSGPGLAARGVGEQGGSESVSLTAAQLPAHNHSVSVQNTVSGTMLSSVSAGEPSKDSPLSGTVVTGDAGEGAAHNNMPPFLGVTFVICLEGCFPSRS